MSWPAGTIVVCINDRWPPSMGALEFLVPQEGQHYTVNQDGIAEDTNEPALTLIEAGTEEWGYQRDHFRLAEGGACESERARQMSEVRV